MVGLVHGLAGSAAIALLVLATINHPRAALFYLLVFGAGTMAGMLALSVLMELAMRFLIFWWKTAEKPLAFATGFLSLAFGLYVVYKSGFSGGLFGATPQWTPR
jgi:high-affinity nickel-transport protein